MKILNFLRTFLNFFFVVGFVTTCSIMLYSQGISYTDEEIRAIAPIVLFNVLTLTVLFSAIDMFRRRLTVDRPVEIIQNTLEEIMKGNFSARIPLEMHMGRRNQFRTVAESINRMAEELEGVETLRTDFVANVSHEMKTPLAVMHHYAAMLQQPELTEAQRLEYAGAIADGSRGLASLITNILKLNWLENQQIFVEGNSFNLTEQLVQSVLQFEYNWEKQQITMDIELEDEVWVESSEELLFLIWTNLLSNALKFTESGGRVLVRLFQEDGWACVEVEDTGCGMSPEVGAHIFEKFYQGDTSHATRGNGLGLALVKRVVDIVSGEISVQSVLGQGSTFIVRVPVGQGKDIK